MPRTSQRDAAGPPAEALDADVALVGGYGSDGGIDAVLEELGLGHRRLAGVEELIEQGVAPGLVVLRVEGALTRGTGALERLRRQWPRVAVVVICEELRPGELRTALAAGASGVVLAGQLATTLGPCLDAARSGQVCVPRPHARQVEPAALSAREKQILGLVVMGYMNSEIGERLFVAESTVKSHLSSAFAKLGVRSRNEAVELILDPDRGLGTGILELGGERVELKATAR
jgi:DNA-binding NarL/FixJ family response regulator